MSEYVLILYAGLPAFLANMAPVLATKYGWLSFFDQPVDQHKTFRGKPIFGPHKTIRGFIVGGIAGLIIGIIQYLLHIQSLLDFPLAIRGTNSIIIFGILGAIGALIGDMIESFFKRQIGIKSGRPLIPFDQTDYIIGFVLLTWPLVVWELQQVLVLLVAALIMNPLTNLIGYTLGIKKTFW